jgi:hypothetical protein
LALLFELLGELTVDKRIAFVLIAIEGLAVRDAAELVGAKPDAVKQRALAARRELEAALSARTGANPMSEPKPRDPAGRGQPPCDRIFPARPATPCWPSCSVTQGQRSPRRWPRWYR